MPQEKKPHGEVGRQVWGNDFEHLFEETQNFWERSANPS